MLYVSDIKDLISQWEVRSDYSKCSLDYALAIQECIFDLKDLLQKSVEEEMSYQDFLDSEADSYLASIEAHEDAA